MDRKKENEFCKFLLEQTNRQSKKNDDDDIDDGEDVCASCKDVTERLLEAQKTQQLKPYTIATILTDLVRVYLFPLAICLFSILLVADTHTHTHREKGFAAEHP